MYIDNIKEKKVFGPTSLTADFGTHFKFAQKWAEFRSDSASQQWSSASAQQIYF